jgi:hypothetical protein
MSNICNFLGRLLRAIFPKARFDNLTLFYVIRVVYKQLLKLNGICNISLVLKNDNDTDHKCPEDTTIILVSNLEELKNYQIPGRLNKLLGEDYFSQGSILFFLSDNNRIVSYTWLHKDFDPDGDVSLVRDKDYYIAGPAFTEIKYRGKGLGIKLKQKIKHYAQIDRQCPIYVSNQFDNIPMLKINAKDGYKVTNVIIRLKNGEKIII